MNFKQHASLFSALALLGSSACGDDDPPGASIVTFAEAPTADCPAGGRLVLTGIDEDGDGALAGDEIAASTPVCNGPDGARGTRGLPGTSALLRAEDEPAGDNCTDGGVRIDVGLDDDGDGTLASGEIDQTTYACDGARGQPGLRTLVTTSTAVGGACPGPGVRIGFGLDMDRDGTLAPGEVTEEEVLCDGNEGRASLVRVEPEPPGANCRRGGQRIASGVDADRSGTLEASEVSEVGYVCDPARALVDVTPEVAGTSTACSSGGARIEVGLDDDGDGALDAGEVRQTSFVCSGADAGRTLVVTTPEPPGASCGRGGQRIDTGFDANADGVLQAGEISETAYVCSGTPGQDGAGGTAVRISAEPPGTNCAVGGTRIQTGPDTNGNGALDDAEVASTAYACDAAATTQRVEVRAEPAGANCAAGGNRIEIGVDTNANGTLDPAEVTTTRYVCDPTSTPSVPFAITTAALPDVIDVVPYDATVTAAGGTGGSYTWTVASGALPPGITLGASGTPSTTLTGSSTVTGSYTFTLRVTDFFGQSAERAYTVQVSGPPCGPGQSGAVGQTLTSITVPSSFSSSVRALAADGDPTGWVYFVEPGIGFNRFRKDGSAKEDDLENNITGLSGGDIGYAVEIDGNDIYLTSDNTSCTSLCVYRVSSDGGQTFSVQDLADFSGGAPNDDLRGIAVSGTTMWVLTHDSVETELYELDLSSTLPATPVRRGVYPDLEYCSGLEVDGRFLYTVCDDVDGSSTEGIARIRRSTFAAEALLALPSAFDVFTGTMCAVHGQDLDADGALDFMFVSGDNGSDFYVCAPGAPATNPFGRDWLGAFSGDDEGTGFDRTNGVVYKVDESSTSAGAFN